MCHLPPLPRGQSVTRCKQAVGMNGTAGNCESGAAGRHFQDDEADFVHPTQENDCFYTLGCYTQILVVYIKIRKTALNRQKP